MKWHFDFNLHFCFSFHSCTKQYLWTLVTYQHWSSSSFITFSQMILTCQIWTSYLITNSTFNCLQLNACLDILSWHLVYLYVSLQVHPEWCPHLMHPHPRHRSDLTWWGHLLPGQSLTLLLWRTPQKVSLILHKTFLQVWPQNWNINWSVKTVIRWTLLKEYTCTNQLSMCARKMFW